MGWDRGAWERKTSGGAHYGSNSDSYSKYSSGYTKFNHTAQMDKIVKLMREGNSMEESCKKLNFSYKQAREWYNKGMMGEGNSKKYKDFYHDVNTILDKKSKQSKTKQNKNKTQTKINSVKTQQKQNKTQTKFNSVKTQQKQNKTQTKLVSPKKPKTTTSNMVTCPHCGKRYNKNTYVKCPNCEKLKTKKPKASGKNKYKSTTKITSNTVKCSKCGNRYNKLIYTECPTCKKSKSLMDIKYCQNCGKKLDKDDLNYCSKCGFSIKTSKPYRSTAKKPSVSKPKTHYTSKPKQDIKKKNNDSDPSPICLGGIIIAAIIALFTFPQLILLGIIIGVGAYLLLK